MKKFLFLIIFIYPLFTSTIHSQVQNVNIPTIEVTGTANLKVNPDILISEVTIQTENNNVVYAKNENDKIVLNVIDILKHYGIQENDIQTTGIRINKNYSYSQDASKTFSAINIISYKLNDLSKYYELTSDLVKLEHISISYSNYDYSKIIEVRKQAREEALLAAKNKAGEMAEVLGQAIGKPLSVVEEQIYDYYPPQSQYNASFQSENTGNSYGVLQQGTINVSARVKLIFELLTK